jgi:dephospho-CoA kinase
MNELFARDPGAVAVIVSALLFEVERDALQGGGPAAAYADLASRIDRIVLVTASEEDKIERYAARVQAAGSDPEKAKGDARSRLAHQIPDREKVERADYLIENSGDMAHLRSQVERLWPRLQEESNFKRNRESLK